MGPMTFIVMPGDANIMGKEGGLTTGCEQWVQIKKASLRNKTSSICGE
jgi:hypothetical protein